MPNRVRTDDDTHYREVESLTCEVPLSALLPAEAMVVAAILRSAHRRMLTPPVHARPARRLTVVPSPR